MKEEGKRVPCPKLGPSSKLRLHYFPTRLPFFSIEMLHAFQAQLNCLFLPQAFGALQLKALSLLHSHSTFHFPSTLLSTVFSDY